MRIKPVLDLEGDFRTKMTEDLATIKDANDNGLEMLAKNYSNVLIHSMEQKLHHAFDLGVEAGHNVTNTH